LYYFLYQQQGGVEEYLIRHIPTDMDPETRAINMGFGEGWKAYSMGPTRWRIVSPSGETYKTKKSALEAYQASVALAADEGDPPWRTTGHE